MITIGTVKFDFKADDEPFALNLNSGWDSFFHTSFEEVVEEVLSAYDQPDRTIVIDSLPLDLGNIEEEQFYKQFPARLREVLQKYCKEKIGMQQISDVSREGIRILSTGRNAFEILSFFLIHGYFPFETDIANTDLNFLLKKSLMKKLIVSESFLILTVIMISYAADWCISSMTNYWNELSKLYSLPRAYSSIFM